MIENKNGIFINKIKINLKNLNFEFPLFIYNYKIILFNIYKIFKLKMFCFFSIKSNDNLFLLKLVNKTINKFDIVSIGEFKKLILISKKKPLIIFSGCGKSISEILISLNFNLFCINVESFLEIYKLFYFFKIKKKKINFMIRINPNINAITHQKISTGNKNDKFGITLKNLKLLFYLLKITKLQIYGYDFHIGSQITKFSPIKKLLITIILLLKIKKVKYIDIGGGLGIDYYNEKSIIKLKKFYNKIYSFLINKQCNVKIIVELGRYIFANTCVLISKVNYIKFNLNYSFVILNVGMNNIIRPALYNSYHKLESFNIGKNNENFFGPICESSDKFLKNKIKVKINSLVFIYSCGSYCKVMNNNYNSKKKIFEILIYKNKIKILFKNEKFIDLINNYE